MKLIQLKLASLGFFVIVFVTYSRSSDPEKPLDLSTRLRLILLRTLDLQEG